MAVAMSKITSKGQTTIPKEIRDRFGLKAKIGRHSSGEGIRQLRMPEKG